MVGQPQHWAGYPRSNDDMERTFKLFSLSGWDKFGPNWEALDARMKQTIARTTQE